MTPPDPPLQMMEAIHVALPARIAQKHGLAGGECVVPAIVFGFDEDLVPYANIGVTGATFRPSREDEGRVWARGDEDSPDVEALRAVIALGGDGT